MIETIKKYKYVIIILSVLLVVYFLIILFMNKTSYEGYFIFKNFGNYKCTNKSCDELSTDTIEEEKITFNIKTKNDYYQNYTFKYVNSWNLFDENKEWKNIEEDYVAYSNNLDIQFLDIVNTRTINSEEEKYVLKKMKYNSTNLKNLDNNNVYELYLNDNDKLDKIILVGKYNVELDSNELFNFIYVEIDGKKNILINSTYENMNSYDVPGYMLYFVYNVNDINESIITIVENYFSNVKEPAIKIYSTKNKKIINLN